MTIKHYVYIGIGVAFVAALLFGGIQSCRLKDAQDKIATEAQKKTYEEEKVRIEKVIVERLDELTSTDLSTIGCNLWGEE